MQMMGISSLLCLLEFQQPQQPPSVASHSPLIAAGLGLDTPPPAHTHTHFFKKKKEKSAFERMKHFTAALAARGNDSTYAALVQRGRCAARQRSGLSVEQRY